MNIHANHVLCTLWLQMDGRRKICFDIINQESSCRVQFAILQFRIEGEPGRTS
jgi:hypothetical protein